MELHHPARLIPELILARALSSICLPYTDRGKAVIIFNRPDRSASCWCNNLKERQTRGAQIAEMESLER